MSSYHEASDGEIAVMGGIILVLLCVWLKWGDQAAVATLFWIMLAGFGVMGLIAVVCFLVAVARGVRWLFRKGNDDE